MKQGTSKDALILFSSGHLLSHGSHCGGQLYVHCDGQLWWSVVVATVIVMVAMVVVNCSVHCSLWWSVVMLTLLVVIVAIAFIIDVVRISGHCLGIVKVSYVFTVVVSHSGHCEVSHGAHCGGHCGGQL